MGLIKYVRDTEMQLLSVRLLLNFWSPVPPAGRNIALQGKSCISAGVLTIQFILEPYLFLGKSPVASHHCALVKHCLYRGLRKPTIEIS